MWGLSLRQMSLRLLSRRLSSRGGVPGGKSVLLGVVGRHLRAGGGALWPGRTPRLKQSLLQLGQDAECRTPGVAARLRRRMAA